jgi:hypothetical protein
LPPFDIPEEETTSCIILGVSGPGGWNIEHRFRWARGGCEKDLPLIMISRVACHYLIDQLSEAGVKEAVETLVQIHEFYSDRQVLLAPSPEMIHEAECDEIVTEGQLGLSIDEDPDE